MNRRLILLRHGDTGLPGRYIGASDVPLSAAGMAQLKELRPYLQESAIDHILSSPLQRCRQTTELLLPGRKVDYDEALREINFGRWEGGTFSQIVESDPELVEQWATGGVHFCFPDGERLGAFQARVAAIGERLIQAQEQTILVVTHGGVIRTLICSLLNLSPSDYLLFQVETGRMATLDLFPEGAVLTGLNLGGAAWQG